MNQRHVVRLSREQRAVCEQIIDDERVPARAQRRALVLLHADGFPASRGAGDRETAAASGVNARTVARVRACFSAHGLDTALRGKPRRVNTPAKLNDDQESRLLALLATPPPPGYPRWTTRTLAVELTGLQGMPTVSRELVRRTLKRHGANGSGSPGAALTAELTPAAGTDKADPGG